MGNQNLSFSNQDRQHGQDRQAGEVMERGEIVKVLVKHLEEGAGLDVAGRFVEAMAGRRGVVDLDEVRPKKVWLLSAAVFAGDGLWFKTGQLRGTELEGYVRGLVQWAEAGAYLESAMGHEATAQLASRLFGVKVEARRVMASLKAGELAVVVRPARRLEKVVDLSEEELGQMEIELSLLYKIS